MKKTLITSAVALLAFASMAFAASDPAATPAAAPAQPTAKAKTSPNDIICHYEQPIGSRLGGHKVCLTRFDWDQQHRNAQSKFDHMYQQDPMRQ